MSHKEEDRPNPTDVPTEQKYGMARITREKVKLEMSMAETSELQTTLAFVCEELAKRFGSNSIEGMKTSNGTHIIIGGHEADTAMEMMLEAVPKLLAAAQMKDSATPSVREQEEASKTSTPQDDMDAVTKHDLAGKKAKKRKLN